MNRLFNKRQIPIERLIALQGCGNEDLLLVSNIRIILNLNK